jgi:YHS domain-containing protein
MKLHDSALAIARSLSSRLLLFLAPLGVAASIGAQGSDGPRPTLGHYNLDDGLALQGYDPTTYFTDGGGKASKGKREITATHRGVTYRFASGKNRARFLASPSRFEPAYGGWCAYAMADGDKVEVDPESFLIEDGRLLVFYDGFWADTRKKWLKEGVGVLRPKANVGWKGISGERSVRDVSQYNLTKGVALNGYDPTTYRAGAPKAGATSSETTFQGVRYRFATAAAKAKFDANPTPYEPSYGGWCAWAMSQGKKVRVDPHSYVQDDRGLFLFFNAEKRDEWLAARESMTRDAGEEWARLTAGD